MLKTFRGGLHMPECKNTMHCAIIDFPAPKKVAIPVQQHIGTPAVPLVSKGDYVKIGQTIGDFKEGLSCPIHASVSGTVVDIEMRNSYTGYGKLAHIIIENDFTDTYSEEIVPFSKDVFCATPKEIIEKVRWAGISGMGGAAFPTHAKIASAVGKATELIVNCAECEPYITENHRLMLEIPQQIIGGAKILMYAIGAKHITFAVEDNKKDAAKVLSDKIQNQNNMSVELLKTKYPQGDERQLMYVLKGIEMPQGKLPCDVGCVIFNAETCVAVYNAIYNGLPLIKTVVTVDGDAIATPQNLRIPIGTSLSDIIDFCGGTTKRVYKIIFGGPMMGSAQWDYNTVVMKNTSAILVLSDKDKNESFPTCIHCGKCVGVCPMHLMPNYLATYSRFDDSQMAEKFNILSCVECGSCTYICPGNVPIVQYIRTQKGKIIAAKKKAAQEREGEKK